MFVHMFKKIYFISKNSEPEDKPHNNIVFINMKDYRILKEKYNTIESLYKYINDLSLKSNPYNDITIFMLRDKDFIDAINDYCSLLRLDKIAIEKIIEHSNLCEIYMEECNRISEYNENFSYASDIFKTYEINEKIKDYDFFPAEFSINNIDNTKVKEKFERFRIYDLYNLIKDIQYLCIRNNVSIYEEIKPFVYNDNSALLLYDKNTFNNVINLLKKLKLNYEKFICPIKEYVNINPNFGYDRYRIYKYNFPLANYLKSIDYKIN